MAKKTTIKQVPRTSVEQQVEEFLKENWPTIKLASAFIVIVFAILAFALR